MRRFLTTITILLTILSFFLTSTSAAYAQEAKFTPTLESFQEALGPDKGYNKQTYDFQSTVGVFGSLFTMLMGCTSPKCPPSLKAGAVNSISVAMAGFYTPPASGVYYLADIGSKFNLVQPAYAQTGTGFRMLQPFLNAWRAVRNLTYVLFVIGITIFGVAIMLRSKISPQAVITIQSALPRIILALILITFSYPIVGLLVDLIYVMFGALVFGLQAGGLYNGTRAQEFFSQFVSSDFGGIVNFVLGRGLQGSVDIFRGLVQVPAIAIGGGILTLVGAAIAILFPALGTAMAVSLIPIVLGLLIAIIGFLIAVLFMLARAFLFFLISLVFSPIIILWSVLTGRGIWEGWLRGLMANLLVFPTVGVVIFLANVLIDQIGQAGAAVPSLPYLGSTPALLQGMIGLGAVVVLPQIPGIIDQILGVRGFNINLPGVQRQFDQYSGTIQQHIQRHGMGPRRGAGVQAPGVQPIAPGNV